MRSAAYQRYRRPASPFAPPPPPPPPPLPPSASSGEPPAGPADGPGAQAGPKGSSAWFVVLCALAGLAFGFGTFAFAFGANIYVDGNAGTDAGQILGANVGPLAMFLLPGLALVAIAVSRGEWEARLGFGLGGLAMTGMVPAPQILAPALFWIAAIAVLRGGFRRFPWDAVAILNSATMITFIVWSESSR